MKPVSYLELAEAVLRTARRPMSPRAIMAAAHRGEIVPTHLHGKTQHKTLQARLSEDILAHGLESRFFRTAPGLFFLSDLRTDPAIDEDFKDPFHARRRKRDLLKPAALAFDRDFLLEFGPQIVTWEELLETAGREGALKHVDPKTARDSLVFVWAFSIVRRGDKVLSYRIGRYRDGRDTFANRKSIGFAEMVGYDDATFFSNDMGVVECGLSAVLADLDLTRSIFPGAVPKPSVSFAVLGLRKIPQPVALFVLEWDCPEWFEPTVRRLSLNEVRWMDASRRPNDLEAFEPWSAAVFEALLVGPTSRMYLDGEENHRTTNRVLTI